MEGDDDDDQEEKRRKRFITSCHTSGTEIMEDGRMRGRRRIKKKGIMEVMCV